MISNQTFRPFTLALSCIALLATGCVSQTTGNEGNLTFQYPADDSLLDFNKPIAIGAKLDIAVREVGTNSLFVELNAVKSDDAKVLSVAGFKGHTLTIEGMGSGSASIEVSAKVADGSVKVDSVNMLSRAAEVLKIGHQCTSDSLGHYLVDNAIWLPYELERKNGQAVIGYGFHPFKLSPSAAMTINQTNKSQDRFRFTTSKTPQNVTLTSTIDDAQLELRLHAPGEIDGALMNGTQDTNTVAIALTSFVLIRPTIGGTTLCQAKADFIAESTTSDICTVKALLAERTGSKVKTGFGWVQITGKKIGKCNFNISYPNAKAGKGLLVPFEVVVEK